MLYRDFFVDPPAFYRLHGPDFLIIIHNCSTPIQKSIGWDNFLSINPVELYYQQSSTWAAVKP